MPNSSRKSVKFFFWKWHFWKCHSSKCETQKCEGRCPLPKNSKRPYTYYWIYYNFSLSSQPNFLVCNLYANWFFRPDRLKMRFHFFFSTESMLTIYGNRAASETCTSKYTQKIDHFSHMCFAHMMSLISFRLLWI